MGYELNKLMAQYGVSSATLPVESLVAPADKPAYDAYKQEYMNRMQDTPMYANPNDRMIQPGPQTPQTPNARQEVMQPGGMGIDAYNKKLLDWTRENPNATNEQVVSGQAKYGITGRDLYGATGNYWGNTLHAPGPQGPQVPQVVPPKVAEPVVAEPGAQPVTDGPYNGMPPTHLQNQGWYARGGPVKFEDGGFVEEDGLDNLASRYPETAPVAKKATIQDLFAKYQQEDSGGYREQLKQAREASNASQQAFRDTLKKAMEGGEESKPSNAEMYFRLAAAIGAPTPTGHISERLSNASRAMADYQKETRETESARRSKNLALTLEEQKLGMQSAKDELNTLRGMAGEDSKDKRAVTAELLKDYIKSGQPQSEAGKVAQDAGLKPGTPEFSKFVNKYVTDKLESGAMFKQIMASVAQGNLANAQANTELKGMAIENNIAQGKKLSPQEANMKLAAQDALAGIDTSLAYLDKAFKLNPNTFDNTEYDKVQRKILEQTKSTDTRVIATRLQSNLLGKKAATSLKDIFGGNPTEGERKVNMALEGIDAMSRAERAAIMQEAGKFVMARRNIQVQRLKEIESGQWRIVTPQIPAIGDE